MRALQLYTLRSVRYAGGDSGEVAEVDVSKSEVSKQNVAVSKKTRTAKEMKVALRFVCSSSGGGGGGSSSSSSSSSIMSCASSHHHLISLCLQEFAKSLRRSSGGGGIIKTGFDLELSTSPPHGHVGDADDAESVVFMEQGRQVYDASHARLKATAQIDTTKDSKARPTTGKSGVSGNTRPLSA